MSIPDMSDKERVNFTAVMEKANYPKGLEGLSRRWNPACTVSFPFPDVRSWRLSSVKAIPETERRQQFYIEQPAGDRALVVIAMSRQEHQYLKTGADGDLLNNPSLLTSMPTREDGRVRLEV